MGQNKFSVKAQRKNFVNFWDFVAPTQLCHCSSKNSLRSYVNEWDWLCTNKNLFSEANNRLDLTCGSLLASSCSKESETLSFTFALVSFLKDSKICPKAGFPLVTQS